MTPHQQQLLRQRDQFHAKGADIRFFDDDPPAGFEDTEHFLCGGQLVNDMMQGIHHDDAFERIVREG